MKTIYQQSTAHTPTLLLYVHLSIKPSPPARTILNIANTLQKYKHLVVVNCCVMARLLMSGHDYSLNEPVIVLGWVRRSQFEKFGPLKHNQLKQPTSHTRLLGFPFKKVKGKNSALT